MFSSLVYRTEHLRRLYLAPCTGQTDVKLGRHQLGCTETLQQNYISNSSQTAVHRHYDIPLSLRPPPPLVDAKQQQTLVSPRNGFMELHRHHPVDGNSVLPRPTVRRDPVQPLQQGQLPGAPDGRSGAAEPGGRRGMPGDLLQAHGRKGVRSCLLRGGFLLLLRWNAIHMCNLSGRGGGWMDGWMDGVCVYCLLT